MSKMQASNSLSAVKEALKKARQWVEANTAQIRGISPEAAKPGEEMLREIDAALAAHAQPDPLVEKIVNVHTEIAEYPLPDELNLVMSEGTADTIDWRRRLCEAIKFARKAFAAYNEHRK